MRATSISLALIAALCLLSPPVEAAEGQGAFARLCQKVASVFRAAPQSRATVAKRTTEPPRMVMVAGAAAFGHAGIIYIPAQRTEAKPTVTKQVKVRQKAPPPALIPGGAPFGFAGNIFVPR